MAGSCETLDVQLCDVEGDMEQVEWLIEGLTVDKRSLVVGLEGRKIRGRMLI